MLDKGPLRESKMLIVVPRTDPLAGSLRLPLFQIRDGCMYLVVPQLDVCCPNRNLEDLAGMISQLPDHCYKRFQGSQSCANNLRTRSQFRSSSDTRGRSQLRPQINVIS